MTRASSPPDDRSDLLARLGLPQDASDADVRDAVSAALGDPGPAKPTAAAGPGHRKPLLALLTLLAAAVVIVGVYQLGKPPSAADAPASTTAAGQRTPAPTPTPDAARIEALRSRLATNPNDVEAMAQLGDAYSIGSDPAQAKEWHGKALAIQPDNTDVLLAYGVDLLNLDDNAGALAAWTKVTQLKPTEVNAWYNIGWANMLADPPDAQAADAAWRKILEIAPDSDLASTVRAHLPDATATPSPTPGR